MPLNRVGWDFDDMKPIIHAENSVKKYGGRVEDYLHIHQWFDDTKAHLADHRHRALKHHTQGIFEAERVFGATFVNFDSKTVSTRDIGEDHVFEDLGFIPTVQDWFRNMNLQPWMGGSMRTPSTIKCTDLEGNPVPDRPSMHEYIDGSSLPHPAFAPKSDDIAATTNKLPAINYFTGRTGVPFTGEPFGGFALYSWNRTGEYRADGPMYYISD